MNNHCVLLTHKGATGFMYNGISLMVHDQTESLEKHVKKFIFSFSDVIEWAALNPRIVKFETESMAQCIDFIIPHHDKVEVFGTSVYRVAAINLSNGSRIPYGLLKDSKSLDRLVIKKIAPSYTVTLKR